MRGEKRRVAKSRELMRLKLKGKYGGRKIKLSKHLFIFMPLDLGDHRRNNRITNRSSSRYIVEICSVVWGVKGMEKEDRRMEDEPR